MTWLAISIGVSLWFAFVYFVLGPLAGAALRLCDVAVAIAQAIVEAYRPKRWPWQGKPQPTVSVRIYVDPTRFEAELERVERQLAGTNSFDRNLRARELAR